MLSTYLSSFFDLSTPFTYKKLCKFCCTLSSGLRRKLQPVSANTGMMKTLMLMMPLVAVGMFAHTVVCSSMNITPIAKSCLDHLKFGQKDNGFYSVSDGTAGNSFTVYCDFTSEPGSAWTLVTSWAFKNKDMPNFYSLTFKTDAPVNENSPNMQAYRLTKQRMEILKSQSSHWRATCNFPDSSIYQDYVRAKFSDFDMMTFIGYGICKKVEFISIRKHSASHTMAQFWQIEKTYGLTIDSGSTGCPFNPSAGAIPSEDNFGFYHTINPKFGCTSGPESLTQYWFGGYL